MTYRDLFGVPLSRFTNSDYFLIEFWGKREVQTPSNVDPSKSVDLVECTCMDII